MQNEVEFSLKTEDQKLIDLIGDLLNDHPEVEYMIESKFVNKPQTLSEVVEYTPEDSLEKY